MARTLGCLVASVTIGAALLEWVQPSRSSTCPPGRQLIALFNEAIQPAARAEATGPGWQAVRIEPQCDDKQAEADTHVVVQRDGRWILTDNWRNQTPVGEQGVVRIGLRASPFSNEVTPPQWEATTQLVHCLREMYEIPAGRVVPHDDLAVPRSRSALPLTAPR